MIFVLILKEWDLEVNSEKCSFEYGVLVLIMRTEERDKGRERGVYKIEFLIRD